MPKKRNYDREYDLYHGTGKQKKRRAQRNASRRKMEDMGKAHKGDNMDVDHRNRNTSNKAASNLRMQTEHNNRSFSRKGEKGHGPRRNKKR